MTALILNRRRLLSGTAGLALATFAGGLAIAAPAGDRKFVFIILRGAMDGLAAVAPYADSNYRAARGGLALSPPGEPDGVLPIADGFGLHPRLAFLGESWRAGELAVLHAAATPYRDRSHFDGQDVLESGADHVFASQVGWLNRAVGLLPAAGRTPAVAVGASVPLVLRGPAPVSSWAPSVEPAARADTIMRLTDLYAGDPLLSAALARAVETEGLVGKDGPGKSGAAAGAAAYRTLAVAAARLLSAPNGPAAAVISLDGWDSHANQGGAAGFIANRLQGLDAALRALKEGMGPQWANTVVVVATEFGRTVAQNGTGGTDHGSGGVALALGGAVKGGRLLGEWPTLAPASLYQGRDLAPANDVRGLFAAVLRDHWGLDSGEITRKVFAGASGLRIPDRLIA
jgi:uncharacterized protein (DUF1501 family)